MFPSDDIDIGIDFGVSGNRSRSLTSTTERIRFGVFRLHRWQVHQIDATPGTFDGSAAYLIKVNYELDLLPDRDEALRWFELGLSLVEAGSGQATVLDALPHAGRRPLPGTTYSVSRHLALVPTDDPAAAYVYQPPVTTAIAVYGIGGNEIRWRHTAIDPAGVSPGSSVAWIVLLVDEYRDTQWWEITARYDLDTLDPDDTPRQPSRRFPLTLRSPSGIGRRGAEGDLAAAVVPSTALDVSALRGSHVPRVFICYAHDDIGHKQGARSLARVLLDVGMDVHLDKWDEGRRRDWQHWAIDQITSADFVVIIASPACRAIGDGVYHRGDHAGIRSELGIIRSLLQRHPAWHDYLLPVVLPGDSIANIPLFLQPDVMDHYVIKDITVDGVSGLVATVNKTPRREWPLREDSPSDQS